MRRFVAGAFLTVSFVLASTTTAGAWYAQGGAYFNGSLGVVQVYAEPGEQNNLTAVDQLVGPNVRLRDPVNPVTRTEAEQPGCTVVDAHTLDCAAQWMGGDTSNYYLEAHLGDGDDSLLVPATSQQLFKIVYAGAGDDTIVGRELGGAYADLGDGNDLIKLSGSSGSWHPAGDTIWAGAGDDVLRLVNGENDSPHCREGNDVLYADIGETNEDCETVHTFPKLP
jgi:hypothetical protein